MEKLARDFMTSDRACCRPHTMLDQVAKVMVQYDCGEIPVLDSPIGQSESSRIGILCVGWSPNERTRWRILPRRAD
jgi:CBS domain-containing protein